MLRYCLVVVASFLGCSLGLAQGAYAPEKSVVLDLQWLSTPEVTPVDGSAMARQLNGTIRMTGRAQSADHFLWPLRYPIPADSYSIMVVRYRAKALANGPTYRDQVIQIALQRDKAKLALIPVAALDEIVQDGSLQEFRKDLTDLVSNGSIAGVGFAFQSDAVASRLDISDIRFERGPRAPRVEQLLQQPLSFVVTDNAGRVIRDADVRAGLLERANWSSLSQTDRSGQAQLIVTLPPLNGVTAANAEAAVSADGFLPRYIAPIDVPQVRPVDVRLTPPASARNQADTPEAVGQVSDGTVFISPSSTTATYDYSYYGTAITPYYVSPCAPAWWLPPPRGHREHGRSIVQQREGNRDRIRDRENSERGDEGWRTDPPMMPPPTIIAPPVNHGDGRPVHEDPPAVLPPTPRPTREPRPIMPSPPNVIPTTPTPAPPPPQPIRDNTPKQPIPTPPAPIPEPRHVEQAPPPPPPPPLSNPPRREPPRREDGDNSNGPSKSPPPPPPPPPPSGPGPNRGGPDRPDRDGHGSDISQDKR